MGDRLRRRDASHLVRERQRNGPPLAVRIKRLTLSDLARRSIGRSHYARNRPAGSWRRCAARRSVISAPARDQRFLVGERDRAAGLDRAHHRLAARHSRRSPPSSSRRPSGGFGERRLARRGSRAGPGQASRRSASRLRRRLPRAARRSAAPLGQASTLRRAVSADFERVGVALDQIEGRAADRARRAEDGDLALSISPAKVPPSARARRQRGDGDQAIEPVEHAAVARQQVPLSLTPARRFTQLSNRSPSCAATATARPATGTASRARTCRDRGQPADQRRRHDAADQARPGLVRADRRRQLRPADRAAGEIGADVGRPGDDHHPEDEAVPCPARAPAARRPVRRYRRSPKPARRGGWRGRRKASTASAANAVPDGSKLCGDDRDHRRRSEHELVDLPAGYRYSRRAEEAATSRPALPSSRPRTRCMSAHSTIMTAAPQRRAGRNGQPPSRWRRSATAIITTPAAKRVGEVRLRDRRASVSLTGRRTAARGRQIRQARRAARRRRNRATACRRTAIRHRPPATAGNSTAALRPMCG